MIFNTGDVCIVKNAVLDIDLEAMGAIYPANSKLHIHRIRIKGGLILGPVYVDYRAYIVQEGYKDKRAAGMVYRKNSRDFGLPVVVLARIGQNSLIRDLALGGETVVGV